MTDNALEEAIRRMGTAAALARSLDLAPSTVRTWVYKGEIPEVYGPALDAIGGAPAPSGGWTREALGLPTLRRPDQPAPMEVLPPAHRVKGVSSYVDAAGVVRGQWIKTAESPEDRLEGVLEAFRRLDDGGPVAPLVAPPEGPSRADLLAVYPLGDPHIGMLSWAEETGADFDLGIAERLYTAAIRDLVVRGPRSALALLINLGDFFHFDTEGVKTTKGQHTLDVDGRGSKVLELGVRIVVGMIVALLQHHDRVIVATCKGNHDKHTSVMLALVLRAHFRDNPRVEIEIPHAERRYIEFGSVLLGTVHGDKGAHKDLPAIMAAEAAAAWGRTTERVIHVGHVHHDTIQEHRGCKVETHRTLAPRDGWHAGQGYVSGRDLKRIVYHKEWGEVSRETASARSLGD